MEEGGERGAPATSHHLPLLDKLASAYAAARSAAAEAAATATGAPHRSNQAVRRRALHRQGGSADKVSCRQQWRQEGGSCASTSAPRLLFVARKSMRPRNCAAAWNLTPKPQHGMWCGVQTAGRGGNGRRWRWRCGGRAWRHPCGGRACRPLPRKHGSATPCPGACCRRRPPVRRFPAPLSILINVQASSGNPGPHCTLRNGRNRSSMQTCPSSA